MRILGLVFTLLSLAGATQAFRDVPRRLLVQVALPGRQWSDAAQMDLGLEAERRQLRFSAVGAGELRVRLALPDGGQAGIDQLVVYADGPSVEPRTLKGAGNELYFPDEHLARLKGGQVIEASYQLPKGCSQVMLALEGRSL